MPPTVGPASFMRGSMCSYILLVAAALLISAGFVSATEKHWIARNAELVVVGRLRIGSAIPWFDGWHLWGTIAVEEVISGPKIGKSVAYRFVCSGCVMWPRPNFNWLEDRRGLWFLRQSGGGRWTTAGVDVGDPGYRSLEDNGDLIQYLRGRNR